MRNRGVVRALLAAMTFLGLGLTPAAGLAAGSRVSPDILTSARPRTALPLAALPIATASPRASSPILPRTVFAYYYPWYSGAPSYRHWAGPNNRLIGSSIPILGAYDSRDTTLAVDLHMRWAQASKIDVLALSWWGRDSYEDQATQGIMDKAAQYGIKVAFLIDVYANRTPLSVSQDVSYLYARYGSHPAFFRASRPTAYGPTGAPRGLFFIYAPEGPGWAQAFDSLRGTQNDGILLVRTDDSLLLSDAGAISTINALHADGMFNFGYYAAAYQEPLPSSPKYLLVFAVQPGFDNTLSGGSGALYQVGRDQGRAYDQVWLPLAQQKPEAVAIDSFNEWGETSQIEPALPNSYGPYPHLDYEGAYGLTGLQAAGAYLLRTAQWAAAYKSG